MGVHAVEFLAAWIAESPQRVMLVTLAPLTNIALLLRTYPKVSANIERIVTMGGSAGQGNATPTAEFNVWHDPEAAAVVFGGDIPMTMYGLDVYFSLGVPLAQVEVLMASPQTAARLGGTLLMSQIYRAADPTREAMLTLGDYGAVAVAADTAGARFERAPVEVVTDGGISRWQTVVDRRPHRDSEPAERRLAAQPMDITVGVDADRYVNLWVSTLLSSRGT